MSSRFVGGCAWCGRYCAGWDDLEGDGLGGACGMAVEDMAVVRLMVV